MRLSPKMALGAAFILACAIAFLSTIASACLALLFAFLIFLVALPPFLWFLRRLLAVNIFLLLLWLTASWSTPGATLWHWGFFTMTREGLDLCLLVTLKANAIVILFCSLAGPLAPGMLPRVLLAFHLPARLVLIFFFMERESKRLVRQWCLLLDAARLRGFAPGWNGRTWSVYGSMLACMLARASEKGQLAHEAMLLRGFTGVLSLAPPPVLGRRDYIFAFFAFFALAAIVLLEVAGILYDCNLSDALFRL